MLVRKTDDETIGYTSAQPAEQAAAETSTRILGSDEADQLLSRLQKQGKRRRSLSLTASILKWTLFGNAAVALVVYVLHILRTGAFMSLRFDWFDWSGMVSVRPEAGESTVIFGAPWLYLSVLVAICWAALQTVRKRQAGLSRSLPHVDDPRALGPLIEALSLGDRDLRNEALEAVIPQLKALTPQDAGRLKDEHRDILHGELVPDSDELAVFGRTESDEFREAVLLAFEQLGNASDAETLRETAGAYENDPEIRAGIETVAAAIERRVIAETAKERLLRAADLATDAEERLLRPAASAETDPATFLRPIV